MFWRRKAPLEDTRDLTAAWILASKDENHLLTYAGLYFRLEPGANFKDLKSLKDLNTHTHKYPRYKPLKEVIHGRRELFRPGATKQDLEKYKANLQRWRGEKHSNYPDWLRVIREGERDEQDTQKSIIDSLGPTDVFRSQFRSGTMVEGSLGGATTPSEPRGPSNIETIQWGLKYIDQLREAAAAPRKERREYWAILVSAGSALIVLVTLVSSFYVVWYTQHAAADMKQMELAHATQLKRLEIDAQRRASLYDFFKELDGAFDAALVKNRGVWQTMLASLDARLRLFSTYPAALSNRDTFRRTYDQFVALGVSAIATAADDKKLETEFAESKEHLANEVAQLFRGVD